MTNFTQQFQNFLSRKAHTVTQLAQHPRWFEKWNKDGSGGKVGWMSMPANYDNVNGLPWTQVRGRYFYPWKEEK